jgi:hypothetical protein
MSAQPQSPIPALESGLVMIECPPCGLSFDPMADRGEAEHLAGVHNDLHHGGRNEAAAVDLDTDRHTARPPGEVLAGPVVSGPGWPIVPGVFADAAAQAVPFQGETTGSERAWSARVDAAVQGMDVLDPTGLDQWMQAHADSPQPHQAEATLVAAWETWLRTDDAPTLLRPAAEAGDIADDGDDWERVPLQLVTGDDADDDADDWS